MIHRTTLRLSTGVRTPSLFAVSLFMAVALSLAGCGGGDSSSSPRVSARLDGSTSTTKPGNTSEPTSTTGASAKTTATPTTAPTETSAVSPGSSDSRPSATGRQSPEFDGTKAADPARFPGDVTDVGFNSPTGNIRCAFASADSEANCQIENFSYTPTRGDCHGGGFWGNALYLNPNGAKFGCAGGVESGGLTLPYGSSLQVGSAICVSHQDGVTCMDKDTRHGFRVSAENYEFF